MEENSEIFQELSIFFGGDAHIEVNPSDLAQFLGHKRLYRIIRLKGTSYKDCVYNLVDNYPESMEALGMLRYYKAPQGSIRWEDIENAEIAMGKELTTNAYGWKPDAWTVFSSKQPEASENNLYEMVAILAFGYDD